MPLTRVIPMISSLKCRVAFPGRKPAGQRLRTLRYAFSLCVVSYVTLLANCGLPALAELPQNDIVQREEFVDVMGDKYRLPGAGESKAVVLLFVGYDCPISNSYAAEIVRLCKEFMPKKVEFCVVYADADISKANASKHAKEYGFCCPAILNPSMTLAQKVGATVKPEVAVLSPLGELLYRGRIDNRYVDFGKRREQVTSHELRDAVEAIIAGNPIATPRTKALGCDIDFSKITK